MSSHLKNGLIYVGLKQSRRALEEANVLKAYVAEDADHRVIDTFVDECKAAGVEIVYVESMLRLGRDAGIERGASVVVELKN